MGNCNCHDHLHHHHDEINEEDLYCDIDPSKICDNCCKCLDTFNTNDKGYVEIPIDKIDMGDVSLEDLYKMYGLQDDDE